MRTTALLSFLIACAPAVDTGSTSESAWRNGGDGWRDREPPPPPPEEAPPDAPPEPPGGNALPIPNIAAPTPGVDADEYTITMREGTAQLRAGDATPIWGFDGTWPGPTIVATVGRRALVTQVNDLPENMTIHNHGHNVAAESDGHPADLIAPGASKTYDYPNRQRGSTYWYHDHAMDLTGPHVYAGLAGFYIIRDPAEDALNLPSGDQEIPMVIQDRTLAADNSLVYTVDGSTIWDGFHGETAFVNGAETPTLNVATQKYRFRVLNGSNARRYRLALDDGQTMTLIGTDGGLRSEPLEIDELPIAPGERYDVVIDFGARAVGTTIALRNLQQDDDDDIPPLTDVMSFFVDRQAVDTSAVPSALGFVPVADPSTATVRRRVVLDRRNGEWVMNGLRFDPNRIDVETRLGQTEIWEIRNPSPEMHPFHLHLIEFQIISSSRGPVAPHLRGFKDTVPVEPGETVELLVTWEGFTGVYVYHCHKLEHEDHRMMLQMRVDP